MSRHGSWATPITSELVVRTAARLEEVVVDGQGEGADVWWAESRPHEGGRSVLVRRSPDGTVTDVLPAPWNARTRVHEYGGAAWTVSGGTVWFTHYSDQRLYRMDPGAEPAAVTPEPGLPAGVRLADLRATPDGLLAVRETHAASGAAADVVNEIVRVRPDGEEDLLVTGPDFVSDPALSPDGALAWLQWDHPAMPWDAAQLVVRGSDGTETVVAGGPGESAVQPTWAADGTLWFLCDRTDVWSLYRWAPGGQAELVLDVGSDIGGPQWRFGLSRFALLDDGRIALAYGRDGADRLAVLSPADDLRELDLPFASFQYLRAQGSRVVCAAGGPAAERVVLSVDVDSGASVVLRPARDLGLDRSWFATPEFVTFPTPDDGTGIDVAHAVVYPPTNPDVTPDGELPPLVVMVHGGPTTSHDRVLNLEIQYFTSRGFCVAHVDYRGSTGYGRRYRDALQGRWGVVDLDDVVACARYLADSGRVDPERMAIRGGSSGGYTVLAALSMRPGVFTAGASHYGVADLGALAAETHKFESRYLDGLIAPYDPGAGPSGNPIHAERSPINHVDALDTPLAVFQGAEDAVVPPSQAEAIVAALRAKGVPHAYLLFPGEQHGFRKAENIRAALDGELSFYAQVWGLELPAEEGIEPVDVVRYDVD
ncbi:S9 family peptidase [Blastococcus sp. TF02-8]|uniref:alpha/beta hydrolase family protein n=1 Tax=Blastococcus sp. TF02-8 TaxID=2250574 RepID=UPI000DE8FE34|nr:S9 family peptidase [Blastococcus sp. TF02-8]RBY98066.1 S9 family peptidase [Blastococcus sp. TF02-8]